MSVLSDDRGLLLAELTYEHTDLATTRLLLRHTLASTLRNILAPRGILTSWRAVEVAHCAFCEWKGYREMRRRGRPRVMSWAPRRAVRNDNTPILCFTMDD